jgi:hypothetical protein
MAESSERNDGPLTWGRAGERLGCGGSGGDGRVGARRQGVAKIPGGSGIRCRDGNELEGGNQAALLDSGLNGCVAAEGGRLGGRHSVNTELGRASRLTRGGIEVAAGPAGAAVATHDNAGDRGRWGIERLVEGRSACDAVLENEARGRHVRKVSVGVC